MNIYHMNGIFFMFCMRKLDLKDNTLNNLHNK